MVHEWMKKDSRRHVSRKWGKKEASFNLDGTVTWVADFTLRQDAGKFMLIVFEFYVNSIWMTNKFHGGERDVWKWLWQNYADRQSANPNRQNTFSRVSAVQESARSPRWEHSQFVGWNVRSHQQCRLRRDDRDKYGCPPFHLEAPVRQHACCTKAKKKAQACHA